MDGTKPLQGGPDLQRGARTVGGGVVVRRELKRAGVALCEERAQAPGGGQPAAAVGQKQTYAGGLRLKRLSLRCVAPARDARAPGAGPAGHSSSHGSALCTGTITDTAGSAASGGGRGGGAATTACSWARMAGAASGPAAGGPGGRPAGTSPRPRFARRCSAVSPHSSSPASATAWARPRSSGWPLRAKAASVSRTCAPAGTAQRPRASCLVNAGRRRARLPLLLTEELVPQRLPPLLNARAMEEKFEKRVSRMRLEITAIFP
jgi:hypothetical protein